MRGRDENFKVMLAFARQINALGPEGRLDPEVKELEERTEAELDRLKVPESAKTGLVVQALQLPLTSSGDLDIAGALRLARHRR